MLFHRLIMLLAALLLVTSAQSVASLKCGTLKADSECVFGMMPAPIEEAPPIDATGDDWLDAPEKRVITRYNHGLRAGTGTAIIFDETASLTGPGVIYFDYRLPSLQMARNMGGGRSYVVTTELLVNGAVVQTHSQPMSDSAWWNGHDQGIGARRLAFPMKNGGQARVVLRQSVTGNTERGMGCVGLGDPSASSPMHGQAAWQNTRRSTNVCADDGNEATMEITTYVTP